MITLSEIVVAGLLEAFVILLVALVLVLLVNHRLHKRRSSLATQLSQLKDTTVFLLDKVNEYSQHTYAFFLDKAVAEAKADSEQLLDSSDTSFTSEQSEVEKAALIRYLLLEAERSAEQEPDHQAKTELRASKLKAIVHDLAASNQQESIPENTALIDDPEFKSKWGHLCDAAIELIATRSNSSEEDLIDIIRVINADLDLDEIMMPAKKEQHGDVVHVREEADRSKELIAKLLAERNAAEAEISMKVTELERLQRYLKESEWCMNQLDEDYQKARAEIKKLKEASENSSEASEMDDLIQKYNRESSEMLVCIETLEQENSDLKSQLGLQ